MLVAAATVAATVAAICRFLLCIVLVENRLGFLTKLEKADTKRRNGIIVLLWWTLFRDSYVEGVLRVFRFALLRSPQVLFGI